MVGVKTLVGIFRRLVHCPCELIPHIVLPQQFLGADGVHLVQGVQQYCLYHLAHHLVVTFLHLDFIPHLVGVEIVINKRLFLCGGIVFQFI